MEFLDEVKKELEKKRKRKFDRDVADIRTILDLPEGRRYLWGLMSEAGVFRTSFTGDNATFFNERKRDIGLSILTSIIEANPSKFQQMQNEHKA